MSGDDIDEVISQLEHFAGLRCLSGTAREIMQTLVDSRVRQAMETVAQQVGKYAASYAGDPPLFDPPKRQRKNGWSKKQNFDHWSGLERTIRDQMPQARDSSPRVTQSSAVPAPAAHAPRRTAASAGHPLAAPPAVPQQR